MHHDPLRTCVACRQTKPQALLLRFSRLSDGEVVPWRSSRAGRSAYVCLALSCLTKASRQRSFERAWARRGTVKVEHERLLGACVDALVNEACFLYRSQQRTDERREAIARLLTQFQSPARGLPQASGGRA